MTDDVQALLDDTDEQLALVGQIYAESAAKGEQSIRLKPRIKNVLENQRSVLDYLAHEIHSRHGTATKTKIYYPLAKAPEGFQRDIDQKMPGVRGSRPDIAGAIEGYQPFNRDWLGWLLTLRNEHGHRVLTKHTRHDTVRTDMEFEGGRKVSMQDISVVDEAGNPLHPSAIFAHPLKASRDVPVIEWRFQDPPLPATLVLGLIQSGVKGAVESIAHVAAL
jgi:hypothetical protein